MKFMHISDVHLGVKPDAGKSWSEKRTQDIWNTFAETIQVAVEEQPDFLFVSGDLFHSQPLKKELKEVNFIFNKIPATKIILMAGNHDYIQQKSYYTNFEWAENVYFFRKESVEVFDFPEENVAVYGLSYWHREIRERLYDEVIIQNQDRINVMLVHGGDDSHIPFSPQRILQNGFDYVAAGHIHKGGQLVPERVVMAGSLEPTDCNDTGAHGYWMGELEKNRAQVHFYPVKKREYRHERIAVSAEMSELAIIEQVEQLLKESPTYQYFRITLEGYADPDITYDAQKIERLPRVVDVTFRLVLNYNYEKMLEENRENLLGNYIQTMNNRPQDAVTKKALEYGVNALLGHQICR